MKQSRTVPSPHSYYRLLSGVAELLESARRASGRSVNAIMTATYWEIGQRIVEFEQRGKKRAEYGEQLLEHLSRDLSDRFGRGFSVRNLRSFRAFYLARPIRQTQSAEFGENTTSQSSSKTSPQLIRNQIPARATFRPRAEQVPRKYPTSTPQVTPDVTPQVTQQVPYKLLLVGSIRQGK